MTAHHLAPRQLWLAACLAFAPAAVSQQELHGAAAAAAQTAALDQLHTGLASYAQLDRVVAAQFGDAPVAEQVALGRRLYFDLRLSNDDTVSCATCHDVTRQFVDHRNVSEGIAGKLGRRNAPTVMNVALMQPLFWDGRAATLEDQAGQPILNPVEMGMPDRDAVVAKLKRTDDYAKVFQQVFGRALNYDDLQRALAAFERTLVFLDAPFDDFRAGKQDAITAAAARGLELFEGKARCTACHPLNDVAPLGTDYRFHNIGVSAHAQDFEKLARQALRALGAGTSETELDRLALATDLSELGRFMVSKNRSDIGAFKTPQLRNIGISAPYMHDGSMQTLWDVMDHYNKGGEVNSYLDGGIEALALTEAEIDDLVAFLFTLTDKRFVAANEEAMAAQRQRAAKTRPFRDQALATRQKLTFEDRVMK